MKVRRFWRSLSLSLALVGGAASAVLGVCGPFTDVAGDSFCPLVLEIFYLGITTGTTPTTYSPADNVSRLQMAAFLSRSVDRVLQRGGRRAALNQYWTPGAELSLGLTSIGPSPLFLRSDGEDVWVGHSGATITRVHGSDGRVLGAWTGAINHGDVLVAAGRVFATGNTSPGRLYRIDPSQPAGAVTTVATNLGDYAQGIAFDGTRIWTTNEGGSVSIVTPAAGVPWPVVTVSSGFTVPAYALYDGANVWITDQTAGTLLKLNGAGAVLQTVTVGSFPQRAVFDGTNIWVPNYSSASVTVVRASSGAVLATLTGNGLNSPGAAAFDGQRVLVTNFNVGADSVSLWKAADLTSLGAVGTGAGTRPSGACSDGINFWITLIGTGQLARF